MICDMMGHGPCTGNMLLFPEHYHRCAGHCNLHAVWMLEISNARINRQLDTMLDFAPWLDALDTEYFREIAERQLPADMWPLQEAKQ